MKVVPYSLGYRSVPTGKFHIWLCKGPVGITGPGQILILVPSLGSQNHVGGMSSDPALYLQVIWPWVLLSSG